MPSGTLKNTLYGLAMPFAGRRCQWNKVEGGTNEQNKALRRILRKRHVVGASIQCFKGGRLTEHYTAGCASLEEPMQSVTRDTVFRTASLAKMVTALLVFRLQTLGKIDVCEDISEYAGFAVRNLNAATAPITLGMLLGHTSSIVDSPAYFEAIDRPQDLSELLRDPKAYLNSIPGIHFRYSNLAAGMIACLLEKHFDCSFETLIQRELFQPLGVKATFDLSTLSGQPVANSYGVFPSLLRFDAERKIRSARPITEPNPQRHYFLASGSLYLTAEAMAKLTVVAWNGQNGFIDEKSLEQMQTPTTDWPRRPKTPARMRHGMGLLQLDEPRVCDQLVWGHQGIAYGSVNGVFFDQDGDGFVSLTSGASEQRTGHLTMLNRDLITLLIGRK